MSDAASSGPEWLPSWTVVAVGCVAVALLDTAGALISRSTGFAYSWFVFPSLALYGALGAVSSRRSIAAAAVTGLMVSLFDVTVGWWIAWQIGPGRLDLPWVNAWILFLVGASVVSFTTTVATAAGAIWHAMHRESRPAGPP
jgi:hypothetical protein